MFGIGKIINELKELNKNISQFLVEYKKANIDSTPFLLFRLGEINQDACVNKALSLLKVKFSYYNIHDYMYEIYTVNTSEPYSIKSMINVYYVGHINSKLYDILTYGLCKF